MPRKIIVLGNYDCCKVNLGRLAHMRYEMLNV